jgi:methylglutaconyl-CoA hydratase
MSYQTIQVTIEHGAATVTLNRPEVRNAFNETVIEEMIQVFQELNQLDNVRAIVLAANGPAFCAGADLNWMKKMSGYTREENLADAENLAEMLYQIYSCTKPVIAKVQGDCYAGGMGLVAACDIAVSVNTAQFCLSEVKLGLVPATISPYVIKAMGANAARRYFITAEKFDAKEAHRIGFIHESVAAEELDSKVDQIVKAILPNGPNAVVAAKWLVEDVAGAQIEEELLAYTAECIAEIRSSDEGKEGVASFLEKRKPNWLLHLN